MGKITRFLKKKRGGAETIGFLATILLLMLVVLSLWPPVKHVFQTMVIESVHRVTLLQMEQNGGFTKDIEQQAVDRMKTFGMDVGKIEVTSDTPLPTQWGSEINLSIKYHTQYTSYHFDHMRLSTTQDDSPIEVTRSSVSRVYFK